MKHFCSFSEAIREGAKLGPQTRRCMMDVHGATCALGAGALAIGFSMLDVRHGCYQEIEALYPYLHASAVCPLIGLAACRPLLHPELEISAIIIHLNDVHGWTREAIADWLETEEEKIGFITLVESESSSESLQRAVISV